MREKRGSVFASGQPHERRMTASSCLVSPLRREGVCLRRYPRIASAPPRHRRRPVAGDPGTADSTRGYFRSLPRGGNAGLGRLRRVKQLVLSTAFLDPISRVCLSIEMPVGAEGHENSRVVLLRVHFQLQLGMELLPDCVS